VNSKFPPSRINTPKVINAIPDLDTPALETIQIGI
jgi:hypothetical protein